MVTLGGIEYPIEVWVVSKCLLDTFYGARNIFLGERNDLNSHYESVGLGETLDDGIERDGMAGRRCLVSEQRGSETATKAEIIRDLVACNR